MKKTKSLLAILAVSLAAASLSSCNSVYFSIKSKGEEITAKEWSDGYISSYDGNLGEFKDNIFDKISLSIGGEVQSSYTLKSKKITTYTLKTKSSSNTSSSTKTTSKETSSSIYDSENNAYKTTTDKSTTKQTPDGSSYSASETSDQYQKSNNVVCDFDLVNKTYSETLSSSVASSALGDSYLMSFSLTAIGVYAALKLAGDSFGTSSDYDNAKFYSKGNVFTIVTVSDYASTLADTTNYENIQGTVEYTRQYIFEKTYMTITKYTDYKKCSWENTSGDYTYNLSETVGETATLKLKGSVSKVYTSDFMKKN